MARTFTAIPMLLGGIGMVAISCSAGSNPGAGLTNHGGEAGASSTATDAGVPPPRADAGADGADSADDALPSAPQAFLRIAQLSPDLPAVDVCVAPHGTTAFQGPLLARLAASLGEDGGTEAAAPGLVFTQVSAYLSLDQGPYDVRLVAAGANSCSSSLPSASAPGDVDSGEDGAISVDSGAAGGPTDGGEDEAQATDGTVDASSGTPDWTDLPPLTFHTYTTLLIAGDWQPAGADPGLTLALLPDDAVLAGPAAALRAVNAVPGWPAADFGLGSFATDWMPVLTGVIFAAASAHAGTDDGVVDPNGYLAISPQHAQAMGARPSSGDAGVGVAVASRVEIDLGSVATVVAVGGKTGDSAHPPALLLCTDNQPSGALLSDCNVSP
jgi:hypothetical protein